MRLLSNRVAILETDGGQFKTRLIIVPKHIKQDNIRMGIVKVVGSKCLEVKVGDKVIYNDMSATDDVQHEGEELRVVREIEIMAKVDE